MSNSLNLLLVIIALVLCEFYYDLVELLLIHHSFAAFAWFAVSSCLGANLRRSLEIQRRYTPGTSWKGMDMTREQEWELDDIRSSRLR
jgi:hypothetical protein